MNSTAMGVVFRAALLTLRVVEQFSGPEFLIVVSLSACMLAFGVKNTLRSGLISFVS